MSAGIPPGPDDGGGESDDGGGDPGILPGTAYAAGQAPEPAVVTMVWEQVTDALLGHLARYVVLSRADPGCRNIDMCASVTSPGRVTVIEKWANAASQQAHLGGPTLLALATAARDLGAARPVIDLLEGISAHDLA